GKTYYFCNPRCAERFSADPENCLKNPGAHSMGHSGMAAAMPVQLSSSRSSSRSLNVISAPAHTAEASAHTHIDPVCGMTVAEESAAGSHTYKGETYYFCSARCLDRFRSDPESFLNKKEAPAPEAT